MNHLDEVPGAVRTDVGGAGDAIDLGCNVLKDRPQGFVKLRCTAGHDRRSVERTLFSPGHTHTNEVDTRLTQRQLPAHSVWEVSVSGVNNNVARLQERNQLVDDGVGCDTGLNHGNDCSRALQRLDKLFHRRRRHKLALVPVVLNQRLGARIGAVVNRRHIAVPRNIARQVATHNCQTCDPNLGLLT